MNLESWLYYRDRKERILSFIHRDAKSCHKYENIDLIHHRYKQEEAEQEIERMLRA